MIARHRRLRLLLVYVGVLMVWMTTTAMHIPDGYLSPVTSLAMFCLVMPFWIIGMRRVQETVDARSVPLIALLAAFSFVIMMFNVPLPGGTTGHAVGAALAAIILGPEIATIAVSIALIIQAVFFGDGGILAIGANCFNMAVVIPYVAGTIYNAVAGSSPMASARRPLAAALGGWVGLTAGAFFAAVEFGIQPLLFHTPDGAPLYAPFPLSVSLPAMVIPHILVASVIEGLLTALIIAYLQRSRSPILTGAWTTSEMRGAGRPARLGWLWFGMIVLIVAAPLGLLAPGTAWGEWGTEELGQMGLGSVPQGLQRLSQLWGAPLADYEVPWLGDARAGYVLSAILGILVVATVVWLFVLLATAPKRTAKQAR